MPNNVSLGFERKWTTDRLLGNCRIGRRDNFFSNNVGISKTNPPHPTNHQHNTTASGAGKFGTGADLETATNESLSIDDGSHTGWKDTELDGKHFRHAAVTLDPVTNIPVVQISFDTEGGKLFQQITKNNIGKKIAIFVGGQMVTSPTVNEEISGGIAVITGSRTVQEARTLAQDLNTGAIPAPIYLTGQYTIEATLGSSALQTSLLAGFIGVIILMIYMLVVYRMLGAVANVALMVYAFILFASLKLPLFLISHTYVVLTLAGMAGIILSVGMAVDANVLVFERMKEELRKGKSLRNSIDSSFK
jgi:protein-export membrane protein SecD